MRSNENASDFATTMSVIHEVLNNYKDKLGIVFQYACCIYPAAPLIRIEHIHEGYRKLTKHNLNSVIPVVAFSYPVWRGFEISEAGMAKMIWPEYKFTRSQDIQKVYHDAGQWYWFKPSAIGETILTENTGTIILSEESVQDIDTHTDWKLAEMKYKL